MFNAATAFDDLEDNAFWADAPAENIVPFAERAAREAPEVPLVGGATFTQRCDRCRGSGRFISYSGRDLGACHACKGAKVKTFKTAPEARAKARTQAADRKVSKAEAWHAAHPAESAWLASRASRSDFARSLQDAVAKWGSLTDNQLAAVQRCIAKDAERAQERAERKPFICEMGKITEAMDRAQAKGVKAPRMVLRPFKLTRQRDGAIKVTHTERTEDGAYGVQAQWLGKIVGAEFKPGRNCQPGEAEALVAACAGLEAAGSLTAFGQRVGYCCACGLELTRADSIERAMGPICFAKYG